MKNKPYVITSKSVYIDPLHCGSTISFRACISCWNALTMEVKLTDCNRQIIWEFREENANPPLAKIDRAIAALSEAREAWIKAKGQYDAMQIARVARHRRRKKKKVKK
jgi:hypothetical protein